MRALSILLVFMCSWPWSSSSHGFVDNLFPHVTVTMQNAASKKVYYMCGFAGEKRELQALEVGEEKSWTFREVMFPLRWCYVHITEDIRGAFWASTVLLKCTLCRWQILDDGVYFNQTKHYLYLH